MEKNLSLTDFLLHHAGQAPVSFHMPGHKGSRFFREQGYGQLLARLVDCDITEIPGADNLFQPEESIRRTMDRYKAMYGARESYMLVNGSSAGILAAILSVVPRGGKAILARNCHKSIFNGISMAGGRPVYVYPQIVEDYGISGPVSPETIKAALAAEPDAAAVILPSPNYYGICSNIKDIARVVHEAGKILIVDQAHGAHLPYFDRWTEEPVRSGEALGADIVIESTHKTLASFTQSAIVNLCTDRVNPDIFADKLQLVESTSPSYLLMASLDVNAQIMENRGETLIEQWKENLDFFYAAVKTIPGLRVMEHPMLDPTKLNLDMHALGLDGLALEEELMERGIYVELVTGNLLMCMSGIGNKRCDYEMLLAALREIANERCDAGSTQTIPAQASLPRKLSPQAVLQKKLEQRDVPAEKVRVPWSQAPGRVCASAIIPYPPGIPIICPGEVMDEEILRYAWTLRQKGEKVMGMDEAGCVMVGK